VAEAAVVGASDPTTGQAIVAFVTVITTDDDEDGEALIASLRDQVAREIGPIAKPARSCSPPSCPRPGAARSCVDCSATWPSTGTWAT